MGVELYTLHDREVTDSTPAPTGPHRRRNGLLAAGALGVLLAGVALGAVLTHHDEAGTSASPATPTPHPTGPAASSPPASAPTTPAGPTDTDTTIPTTTPAGLRWTLVNGEWEPFSATAGPTRIDGPVATGYARTPLGALLAAQQIGTRFSLDPAWRQVVDAQVVPDAGRDAYVRLRAAASTDALVANASQPAGFRYVSWTPDLAVVQLLEHTYNQQVHGQVYGVLTTTLRWLDGDWKLQLLPNGGTSPSVTSVAGPTGFVLWGAPGA